MRLFDGNGSETNYRVEWKQTVYNNLRGNVGVKSRRSSDHCRCRGLLLSTLATTRFWYLNVMLSYLIIIVVLLLHKCLWGGSCR